MVKFKAKLKNGQVHIKAKLSAGDEISGMEFNILLNERIRGLLIPEKKKKNLLIYTGEADSSLYDRLKRPVTQYEFFSIILQATEVIKHLENSKLFLNNLILDLRYTYIHEMRKELRLIYVPVVGQHVQVNTKGFLESIVYMAFPVSGQNSDYIEEFSQFIQSMETLDTKVIEDYITSRDRSFNQQITNKPYIPKTSGTMTSSKTKSDIQYGQQDDNNYPTMILDDEEGTVNLGEEDDTVRLLDENEGTVALDEDDGTVALYDNVPQPPKVIYPSMTRGLTNETVSINKPVFRLGKEKSYVDYFVANNNAVSRSHADIITRNGKYYIQDLNSKNGTYVNGQRIPVRYEKEICDGDKIVLGNEEFTFHTNMQ